MMCLFCINATIIMAYIKIVLAFLKPVLNRPAQVLLQGSSPCDTLTTHMLNLCAWMELLASSGSVTYSLEFFEDGEGQK